uniref:Uncharacterized protein n=1 Tax=Arundo donax TaxID=35708 RepID=A0A0A9B796_ARUDO
MKYRPAHQVLVNNTFECIKKQLLSKVHVLWLIYLD